MFQRMPTDSESPCGHSPAGNGAALTGAGSTYMFCLLKSDRLDEPPDPPAPPAADKVPLSEAVAPEFADALALASEFECTEFELLSVFVEVDGAEGVTGGVQVGQLVPPFWQVACEAALAMASAAATIRWVGFTVGPWWWFGWLEITLDRPAGSSRPLPSCVCWQQ